MGTGEGVAVGALVAVAGGNGAGDALAVGDGAGGAAGLAVVTAAMAGGPEAAGNGGRLQRVREASSTIRRRKRRTCPSFGVRCGPKIALTGSMPKLGARAGRAALVQLVFALLPSPDCLFRQALTSR